MNQNNGRISNQPSLVNQNNKLNLLAKPTLDKMKIAVFHNFLDNIGGAEIVSLTLARELKADLYTTNFDMGKIKKMGFSDVHPISIGRVPLNAPFRQQLALSKFRNLNLKKKYDFFIISGDWAMSGAVNNKPNLWYVHSPIREIWDLYEYTRKNTVPFGLRTIFDIWVKYNRHLNRKYIKEVDSIVCNSSNTRGRLKKYLGRQAEIIYPPIETSKYFYKKHKNYWLSVNRLITHKRVDMQIKAFSKLPEERLIIVGSYEKSRHFKKYAEYIKKIKPGNVTIISWADSKQLVKLYSECKGFITTAQDEDFGMTPLEAMASGKPVIAPNEGGYKETVTKKTGILIDNINEKKLIDAVLLIGKNPQSYKSECIKQARKFDTEVFIKKMKNKILL
jgi:glycosyltransferase involved in cell wall biosynthesis